jgi:hypothetical protein
MIINPLNENVMKIDFKKIKNVEIENVQMYDYPDFCDAFLVDADYGDKPMTEEMINYINDNEYGFINEYIHDHQLYC